MRVHQLKLVDEHIKKDEKLDDYNLPKYKRSRGPTSVSNSNGNS
jgi:hypothetical protein